MRMIERSTARLAVQQGLRRARVVLLTGARQVGKTTLARTFVVDPTNRFDLENPVDLARLDAPMLALQALRGVVVIDEVQRSPDLFPVLRVLADRPGRPATFLVLGSASPSALRQASESLTGRIEYLELGGLRLAEVSDGSDDVGDDANRLWRRGGVPLSYLAETDDDSTAWLRSYVLNLARRDLPEFGVGLPAATVERFLGMVAHVHGQLWNAAVPARALGIAESTARRYIDVLSDALLVRVLQPWHENMGKRLVKTPKVYYRDSGLLHQLLGVVDELSLLRHPAVGASWEGWVIEEVIQAAGGEYTPYFWRTSAGAELDLLLVSGARRIGVDVKRADAPRITASMRAALADLRLDHLYVIYPGTQPYSLDSRITVLPMKVLAEKLDFL
jgi:uncharacterized protein